MRPRPMTDTSRYVLVWTRTLNWPAVRLWDLRKNLLFLSAVDLHHGGRQVCAGAEVGREGDQICQRNQGREDGDGTFWNFTWCETLYYNYSVPLLINVFFFFPSQTLTFGGVQAVRTYEKAWSFPPRKSKSFQHCVHPPSRCSFLTLKLWFFYGTQWFALDSLSDVWTFLRSFCEILTVRFFFILRVWKKKGKINCLTENF